MRQGKPLACIRDARAEDFEKVYPLLLEFNNDHLTKEHWRQLFVDHSGCQNGRFGYILFDGEAAVGFIGATFSERTLGGETHRICNMSNWIVKNEYRSHSLGLLSKVVASKAAAITNITPTPLVLRVCQKMGFTPMDKSERIVLPSLTGFRRGSAKVLTKRGDVEAALSGEQLKICRDHSLPWNRHALILAPEGECYLMMNRSEKTTKTSKSKLRVPFARVHHLSNADIFAEYADCLALALAADLKVVGMIVEERMLRGRKLWHSFPRPGAGTAAFRSSKLTALDIGNLYSEMVFNLTTRRYTEHDLQRFRSSPESTVYIASVADKFGDNGKTLLAIVRKTTPDVAEIDTFLMSCRVMGRFIEDQVLDYLAGELRQQNVAKLRLQFFPRRRICPCVRCSRGSRERSFLNKRTATPRGNTISHRARL